MKEYTSCFVGIPLSEKYQKEFEELLVSIKRISSEIEITQPGTPHITVCYLDKQSQQALPQIADSVSQSLKMLRGVKIEVGGLGYFRDSDPKVTFLNVAYPPEVERFSHQLTVDLAKYTATESNLPFHPHMTVAWLPTPVAKLSFWDKQNELSGVLQKNWAFDLDEIGIYGVDSTKSPQFQEKLISLKVS